MERKQTKLDEKYLSNYTEQILAIRQRRRFIEQQWLRAHHAWMNLGLERRFHTSDTSTNDYNLPVARRSLERTIVRGAKTLTPNAKWFEIQALGDASDVNLSNVDAFMNYVLRKKIKTRSTINQLVRTAVIYGRCHLKTSIAVKNGKVWPSWRAVDPFSLYIFPETATSPDEVEITFEDFLFSYQKYMSFVKKGLVEEIKHDELTKPEWPYHFIERLSYQGITDVSQDVSSLVEKTKRELEKSGMFVSLTELWCRHEDELYQVYVAWNCHGGPRIVGQIESEYDEPLYRSVTHRSIPGEAYTNSLAEDVTDLHHLSNDQLNKYQEAVDRAQGIFGVDVSMKSRKDALKIKPGAVWEFEGDPRMAMIHTQLPDVSPGMLRAWQIYLALINSLSGAGTIAEGQPGRNMPRAGQATESLISLALVDIQDIVDLIEQEVLTYGLDDIYKVSANFIPDYQLMLIPGGKSLLSESVILKKEQILGDYEFFWNGANQFQQESQRSQQLLIFLNMIPTIAPILAQQGYAFNMVELIQMVWRYGLGERGLKDVIVPLNDLQLKLQEKMLANKQDEKMGDTKQNGVPNLGYSLPTVTDGFMR